MSAASTPEQSGSGRVVLVTGGSRGLGRGLVEAFAKNGDFVVTCGRNVPESAEPAASFYRCDVRDPAEVEGMIAELLDQHGRLDVLVNNAGGTPYAAAATMSPRLFERIVALNLCGAFYVAQKANQVMQSQDAGGVIVNVGSTAAMRPAPGVAPYIAAKAGLAALTRSLALEWGPKVRVNLVTPGLLETELLEETYGDNVAAVEATVPLGRFAVPEDIAGICLMVASPAAAYVSGAEIVVDGGGETPAWFMASGHG